MHWKKGKHRVSWRAASLGWWGSWVPGTGFPVLEMHEERAQPSLISGPQKRDVIAPVKCATKNTQFGNVMCSREWNIERSGRRRRNLDCVTVAWGKGTLVINVLGAERVKLTDARTDTTGYFMRSKWLLSPWRGRLIGPWLRKTSSVRMKEYTNMQREVYPCLLFRKFWNVGGDVCKFIVSWTKAMIRRMLTRMW